MPITSTTQANSPPIPNAGQSNRTMRTDAATAIAGVQLADVWRQGTISNPRGSTVRVDCQGVTAAGVANLQVQINNQRGNSTIACALVAPTLTGNTYTNAQQLASITAIQTALNNSLAWQEIVTLTGAP